VSAISKYSQIEVAIYKGDELLATGKINDVARELGVAPGTVYFYTMPVHRRRIKKFSKHPERLRIGVRLEDDK